MTMCTKAINAKLLLLMGPSGSGKSTLIRALEERDSRFEYIAPFMTRELRPGERDKVSVTKSELQYLWESGELLVINELYGVRYGTPRRPIATAFDEGRFPLLDWPISRLSVMEAAFPSRVFRVYVKPPSDAIISERLVGRNNYPQRVQAAYNEMRRFEAHEFDESLDLVVVTRDGDIGKCAERIYQEYLRSIVRIEGR